MVWMRTFGFAVFTDNISRASFRIDRLEVMLPIGRRPFGASFKREHEAFGFILFISNESEKLP